MCIPLAKLSPEGVGTASLNREPETGPAQNQAFTRLCRTELPQRPLWQQEATAAMDATDSTSRLYLGSGETDSLLTQKAS